MLLERVFGLFTVQVCAFFTQPEQRCSVSACLICPGGQSSELFKLETNGNGMLIKDPFEFFRNTSNIGVDC